MFVQILKKKKGKEKNEISCKIFVFRLSTAKKKKKKRWNKMGEKKEIKMVENLASKNP